MYCGQSSQSGNHSHAPPDTRHYKTGFNLYDMILPNISPVRRAKKTVKGLLWWGI